MASFQEQETSWFLAVWLDYVVLKGMRYGSPGSGGARETRHLSTARVHFSYVAGSVACRGFGTSDGPSPLATHDMCIIHRPFGGRFRSAGAGAVWFGHLHEIRAGESLGD